MPAGEVPWPPRGPCHVGSSLVGPGPGFWVTGWPVGNSDCTTLVLFQHGSAPSPLQMAHQQGQDVLDTFFSQLGPAWQQAGQPP